VAIVLVNNNIRWRLQIGNEDKTSKFFLPEGENVLRRVATVSASCGFFFPWSSFNHFALAVAAVSDRRSACPIQIDDVRLPLGYRP
jgi:hypothetical protein